MKLGWAHHFAWAALCCASCIPPRLTAGDGAVSAPDVAPDRAAEASPMGGRVTLKITADEDDAVWINRTDERLHYSSSNFGIEVGTDAEVGRVGLRFKVSLPRASRIVSATLALTQHSGEITLPSAMTVEVYDSVDVPPFSDLHDHLPQDHDPNHLWGHIVNGFMVCDAQQVCASPNLMELVQRIVDKSAWTGTGFIGFVVAPDPDAFDLNGWVAFEDSSSGTGPPFLEIVYGPPP